MPCHEDIWGNGDTAPPFLTLALDGGECSASCLGHFTPGEISPSTHWIGGWVDPRTDLDGVTHTNDLSSFKIAQVSHFLILSHRLSLNTITNAPT
jgi:hypothetical protein